MLDKMILKAKRGNMLSLFYQEMMEKRAQKEAERLAKRNAARNYEFAGQHTSKLRQQKLAYMAQFGLKTGKQFRRHMKAMRRVA